MKRVGVVLFNLGGPDSLSAVKPFLFNLFNDPAIIGAPAGIRWLIAKMISSRRAPIAREIYRKIGGASPILDQTQQQARALETRLKAMAKDVEWRVVISMRYWKPYAEDAVGALQAFDPDRIVLLPLYPQYSTTTTGSSLASWRTAAAKAGLERETSAICCYPDHHDVIEGQFALVADAIARTRQSTSEGTAIQILLSAHGLPKKIIEKGDPYQWQVERTSAALGRKIEDANLLPRGSKIVTCYQSRVGPLEWIGPSTDEEIKRAGEAGAAVVVVPIAFVSEHSETLVELDMEYAELARSHGVVSYSRVPALACDERFIAGLSELVLGVATVQPADTRPVTGMVDRAACRNRFASCPRCSPDR